MLNLCPLGLKRGYRLGTRTGAVQSQRLSMRGTFVVSIALTIAACGGGGTNGSSALTPLPQSPPVATPSPFIPPVQGTGSVTIRLATSAGTPVAGVSVSLNGGFNGRSATSDVAGIVRFAQVPSGEARASTYTSGFHPASARFVVTPDADLKVVVTLEQVEEAIPVVFDTRAVPENDGSKLTVDVDVAILGEDGRSIETLTAADFSVHELDCGWIWCVLDDAGRSLPNENYHVALDAAQFGWTAPSSHPRALATALLLEQSADMGTFDPEALRLGSVNTFLDRLTAPDTVSVASYRGVADGLSYDRFGPFTSDASTYRGRVAALAGMESGTNPLNDALMETLSFTVANAPGSPDDPRRAVVAVTAAWPSNQSAESALRVIGASRSAGTPVVAIDSRDAGAKEAGAHIAAWTGGAAVTVQDPRQFPVVFGNLRSIVGSELGFDRVRLVLNAEQGVFRSGHTVLVSMSVRIGPDSRVWFPVVVPID